MKPININGMSEDDIITWWKTKRTNWKKKSPIEKRYREDEKLLIYRYIHELMRRGFSKKNIIHHLMDKVEMSYESANNFSKDAMKYLVADADDTLDETREIARERLTDIYKKAVEQNQPKIALTALNELNKINGLHENKVEVKTDATITFEFS